MLPGAPRLGFGVEGRETTHDYGSSLLESRLNEAALPSPLGVLTPSESPRLQIATEFMVSLSGTDDFGDPKEIELPSTDDNFQPRNVCRINGDRI